MDILRSQNKITDFLMILAWAIPFNPIENSWAILASRASNSNPAVRSVATLTTSLQEQWSHIP